LQEQEAAFSLTSYLATIQSELVKSNSTQEMSSSPDNETVSYQPSPSGTTYAPSTESRGEEQLTFLLEDSPAKTSVRRVKEQELAESVQAYGKNMRDSLKRYNLDLSLPKTHHCFGLGDLELSSKTWPRWGIMLDGELSELGLSVRRINETGCGCLPGGAMIPTPVASDGTTGAIIGKNDTFYTTKTGMPRKINQKGTNGSVGLGRLVQMWPTPTCHNAKEQDSPAEATRNTPTLCHQARGGDKTQPRHLNPSWVEWLMGWPIGYTDLKPLETDKFRNVQQWHSTFSHEA
jgi:hypothetical protein